MESFPEGMRSLKRWTIRRLAVWATVAVGSATVVWLGGCAWLLKDFTSRARNVYAEPIPAALEDVLQPVRIKTSDGEDLGAWFWPGQKDRPVAVLLHGNGADRSACLIQGQLLQSIGCGSLLVTVRAHGDSTGAKNDIGYSARLDVRAIDVIARMPD